MNDLLLKMYS